MQFLFVLPFILIIFSQHHTHKTALKPQYYHDLPGQSTPPQIDVDFLMGKFEPAQHPDFVKVEKPYTERRGMLLHREAFLAFQKMWKAAKKDGVHLNIISSTRNFQRQKEIWENKWVHYAAAYPDPVERALKILEYSSMPGTSRHHWGTDIDLNDLENASFEAGGKYEKVYRWLLQNASRYGFGQPYTAGRPTGYREEKWHWSYLPLAKAFLTDYLSEIRNQQITSFLGAETATAVRVVEHFVAGVDASCKN